VARRGGQKLDLYTEFGNSLLNVVCGIWRLRRSTARPSNLTCTFLVFLLLLGNVQAIGNVASAAAAADPSLTNIVLLTLNVSGGLRKRDDLLRAYVDERKPDFLVVTETGLTSNFH